MRRPATSRLSLQESSPEGSGKSSKTERRNRIQRMLEDELVSLKSRLGLAGHLRVVWNPKPSSDEIHGRVEGSIIHVFDIDEKEALHTLRHEYVEYILTNEFLTQKLFEAQAHRRADALVDIIASLL